MTELTVTGETAGNIVYALLRRDSDEKVYSTATSDWATFVVANYANYAVLLTETPANSRFWVADLPTNAVGTRINVTYLTRAGASPSITNDNYLGSETLLANGSVIPSSTTNLITQVEYEDVVDTDATDDKLEFLISAATAAIKNYCNFTFVEETITEYINGTGYNFLDLSALPTAIVSLTEDPEGTTSTTYSTTELSFSERGRLYFKPSATTSAFTEGYRNWKVVFTSYGVVPADLKMACITLVQAMELSSDSEKYVSEKAIRDVKQKWDTSFLESSDGIFSEVKQLLAPYRRLVCI